MRRAIAVAPLIAYAWMSSGVAPFSALSYLLVAIPSLTMVTSYAALGGLSPGRSDISAYYQRRSHGASLATTAPWTGVLVAVMILEAVGLALGGRSPSVPTLSTTVDHLLAARWGRCLMLSAWLLVGGMPLRRLWRFLHGEEI